MSVLAQQPTQPVVLTFPGQGSQHPRMAAGLYRHETTFTYWMDEAFRLFGDLGAHLRQEWLAITPSPSFDDVTVAQPLLYAVNHALGRLVLSWGVEPVAMLGHSVGEFVAATLAGVLDFADGIRLMRERTWCFAETPAGGMLAIAASEAEVADVLGDGVYLAAVNASRQLLLSGELAPLAAAAQRLQARGIVCIRVPAQQAFHSPVVDEAVRLSLRGFRAISLRPPVRTLYSAYTTDILTEVEALDPEFWAWQAARTVRFAPTLATLLDDHDCLLLETGPSGGLSLLARRQSRVIAGHSSVQPLLPGRAQGDRADREAVAAVRHKLFGALSDDRAHAVRTDIGDRHAG
ncbi:MAG: Acyl transferase [Glaciihabitans sp.]|nr:Acyl transferase [Glaciihabitans sp.]